MTFLAQLDYADIEQYSEGIIYAFICRSTDNSDVLSAILEIVLRQFAHGSI